MPNFESAALGTVFDCGRAEAVMAAAEARAMVLNCILREVKI